MPLQNDLQKKNKKSSKTKKKTRSRQAIPPSADFPDSAGKELALTVMKGVDTVSLQAQRNTAHGETKEELKTQAETSASCLEGKEVVPTKDQDNDTPGGNMKAAQPTVVTIAAPNEDVPCSRDEGRREEMPERSGGSARPCTTAESQEDTRWEHPHMAATTEMQDNTTAVAVQQPASRPEQTQELFAAELDRHVAPLRQRIAELEEALRIAQQQTRDTVQQMQGLTLVLKQIRDSLNASPLLGDVESAMMK
jgi:hypothetical protein